jgi:hypothetical protein
LPPDGRLFGQVTSRTRQPQRYPRPAAGDRPGSGPVRAPRVGGGRPRPALDRACQGSQRLRGPGRPEGPSRRDAQRP